MIEVVPYAREHLRQLQELVNGHLGAAVPGWALPAPFIEQRLERDPRQYVIDPWVTGRTTLCAVENHRLVAAAQLRRYGDGREVSDDYRRAVDVSWFLFWPESRKAAEALLSACHTHAADWQPSRLFAWDAWLPVPTLGGIPDLWPHIEAALHSAGYKPKRSASAALYSGPLETRVTQERPPVDGLTLSRTLGRS